MHFLRSLTLFVSVFCLYMTSMSSALAQYGSQMQNHRDQMRQQQQSANEAADRANEMARRRRQQSQQQSGQQGNQQSGQSSSQTQSSSPNSRSTSRSGGTGAQAPTRSQNYNQQARSEAQKKRDAAEAERLSRPTKDYKEKKKGSALRLDTFEYSSLALSSIAMIASIIVGLMWVNICFTATGRAGYDGMVFVGAAILFVALEVQNFIDYKKVKDHETKIYKDREFNKQADGFKRAEKQIKSARKAAEKRAQDTMMASIAFMVAAGVALAAFIIAQIPEAVGGNKNDDDCKEGGSGMQAIGAVLKLMGIDFAFGWLIDTAAAALNETFDKAKSQIQDNGAVRAVIYMVFAALAMATYALIQQSVKELEKREKQYKRLYAKLMQLKASTMNIKNPAEMSALELKELDDTVERVREVKKKCAVGDHPASLQWDDKCKCVENNSCKKVGFPELHHVAFETPGALGQFLGDMTGVANNTYAGNQTQASRYQAQANGRLQAVGRAVRYLKDTANDVLKQNGKKPVDWDGLEKTVKDNFLAKIKKDVEAMPPEKQQGLLDYFSGGLVDENKMAETAPAPKKYEPTVMPKQSLKPKKKFKKFGRNRKLKEEHAIKQNYIDASKGLDIEGSNNADIDGDADKDLFLIIHNRYIKSYDKLSDGIEEEE